MRTSISGRVQKHRAGLRVCGLRPIQIRVPDTRRPGFAEECRRQSRLLRDDPRGEDTLTGLSAPADTDEWE